jgi:hypothetical protein
MHDLGLGFDLELAQLFTQASNRLLKLLDVELE